MQNTHSWSGGDPMYRIYMNESHERVNTDPKQRSAAGQKIEINFH